MDVLARIKRCGRVRFTYKATEERTFDGLSELEILESPVNAVRIDNTLRSTSRFRGHRRDCLYVIKSSTVAGVLVFTKGKLVDESGEEIYYLLVSAKLAT